MSAPRSRLTRFQVEVLEAFFRREGRFYLTGGGALAGFHLGHRETHDLDLFTLAARPARSRRGARRVLGRRPDGARVPQGPPVAGR